MMDFSQWSGLAAMLALCILGWKLADLVKLPAAPILGSLLAVAAANVLSVNLYLPSVLRSISSIGIGIMVGCRFNVKLDRKMIPHLLLFTGFILASSVLLGLVVRAFGIDGYTAMFCGMLGGLTELSLIALEFDAVSYQVSLFHTVRMVTLMLVIPYIARKIPPAPALEDVTADMRRVGVRDWIIIIVSSTAVGALLGYLRLPAGRMIGAMAASAIYTKHHNIGPKANRTLHSLLQCLVGGAIGLGVTGESIAHLKGLIIPLLVVDALVLMGCLLLTKIMCRVAKWDRLTSLLASTPGGLGPTVLLSVEMGANSTIVSLFQIIRYLSVILFTLVLGIIIKM